MGGPGYKIRTLFKRFLEVGADQPQNVSHVVHDDRIHTQAIDYAANFCDGFPVEDHAFAKDNQLRRMFLDEGLAGIKVNLIGVFRQDRKIYHRRFFRQRVPGHKVSQRSHGLCTQMTALDDMVVHHFPEAPLFIFAVGSIDIINQCTEQSHVCHLAGNQAGFDLLTPKEFF